MTMSDAIAVGAALLIGWLLLLNLATLWTLSRIRARAIARHRRVLAVSIGPSFPVCAGRARLHAVPPGLYSREELDSIVARNLANKMRTAYGLDPQVIRPRALRDVSNGSPRPFGKSE